jgi:hypothetical protein
MPCMKRAAKGHFPVAGVSVLLAPRLGSLTRIPTLRQWIRALTWVLEFDTGELVYDN